MRWGQLQVIIVCIHDEPFEATRALIVHSVVGWTETPGCKKGEDFQIDPTQFSFGAIADESDCNVVSIRTEGNHNILVSPVGEDRKMPGKIHS